MQNKKSHMIPRSDAWEPSLVRLWSCQPPPRQWWGKSWPAGWAQSSPEGLRRCPGCPPTWRWPWPSQGGPLSPWWLWSRPPGTWRWRRARLAVAGPSGTSGPPSGSRKVESWRWSCQTEILADTCFWAVWKMSKGKKCESATYARHLSFHISWKNSNRKTKENQVTKLYTVMDIVFGTGHCFWDSRYLCHFSTEMTEIWCPGTFSKGVWTHKIAL